MNQSKIELALAALEVYFTDHDSVTTLEFKEYLRTLHPDVKWSQSDVSLFMMNVDGLFFTDNGTFRTYYPIKNDVKVNSNILESICLEFDQDGIDITKTNLKSRLREDDVNLDDFKQVFNSMNFVHTGKYTKDNHKIYKLVDDGQHLSQTKGEVMDINSMHKDHIANTIFKYHSNMTLGTLLTTFTKQRDEAWALLKAYITWDIRNILNKK